jgi:hypothetical protein
MIYNESIIMLIICTIFYIATVHCKKLSYSVDIINSWFFLDSFAFLSNSKLKHHQNFNYRNDIDSYGLLEYDIRLKNHLNSPHLLIYDNYNDWLDIVDKESFSCYDRISKAKTVISLTETIGLESLSSLSYFNNYDNVKYRSTGNYVFNNPDDGQFYFFAISNCNMTISILNSESTCSIGPVYFDADLKFTNGRSFLRKHLSVNQFGIFEIALVFVIFQVR